MAVIILITAGCSSTHKNILTGDTLRYEDLKLSVTKPATWRYLTAKEKRDARTANTYSNKLYDSAVKLEAFPPRIIIAKYPEPHRGLNPHITIDRYPLDDLRFKTSEWLAFRVLRNFEYYFDGIRPVTPVHQTQINGKPAATFRIRYTLQVKGGPLQEIDEQVWCIATGITAYLISGRSAQAGADAEADAIAAVIESLTFDWSPR